MLSHNIAKILRELADMLESGPNVELSDLAFAKNEQNFQDINVVAVNLRTLAALSKIGKKEWIELIDSYGFNINITKRDSARNILGKLLNHLDSHPHAIEVLKKRSKQNINEPSALSKALDVLLEGV